MKRISLVIAAFTIIMLVFTGCGQVVNNNPKEPVTNLSYYVVGEQPKDVGLVTGMVNETLVDKVKAKINMKFVTTDNYSLLLSSGENIDLIASADWMQFWDNAAKNAFMEISDDMLKKYAPISYKEYSSSYLKYGKLRGKRYSIPAFVNFFNKFCYIVRGDLMKKYNIPDIKSMDDFGLYLDAIAKNEKGMTPLAIEGSNAWRTAMLYTNKSKWVNAGASNATSPIFARLDDPQKKFFLAIDQPETRDFSMKMKEWNNRGYWSKSALANNGTAQNDVESGKAASFISLLEIANSMYNKFQSDPVKKSWDLRAYDAQSTMPRNNTAMSGGMSIGFRSKNTEKCLQVIDILRNDERLNKLIMFGVEGTHYKQLPDNHYEDIAVKDYPGAATSICMNNEKWFLTVGGGIPQRESIEKKIKETYIPNPLLNLSLDTTDIKGIVGTLNNVWAEFSAPRCLGFVEDVDKAIATERKKLIEAGVMTYMEKVQAQVDDYLKTQQ